MEVNKNCTIVKHLRGKWISRYSLLLNSDFPITYSYRYWVTKKEDLDEMLKDFLNELGDPFFILLEDPDGKKAINFGVYGIPETILISKELIILKKYIGPLDSIDVSEISELVKW